MSVILQVAIPDDLLPALERRAREAGMGREEYASAVLAREVGVSLDEVLAGFRADVAASGLSDEALTELFAEACGSVQTKRKR
jgi:hypothetical protein